ncbi:hypothetical protein [Paraburkholderia terricola]|jgi:hypothetical protein|uniref:PD-(D/E)XK nuclease superfamily protein n=1 Tax=Paraburkholderia terricola TaxID=169427 RepID=A0ABU1M2A4_9BURK|nr:hypothetical protein [Paraburkholderia terricola]MDR6413121.1 hypothetical protein [Paraburkholderia terricola]MDR6450358.1 hypothetical protein [Paraburkholderia terricola]MDR6485222.1 hypothetical protein [Paraburkholderia terricola]
MFVGKPDVLLDAIHDRVVLVREAKRHATTVGEYLRFNFSGFHGRFRRQRYRASAGFSHTTRYQSAHGHQGCEALIRLARESRITSGGDDYQSMRCFSSVSR